MAEQFFGIVFAENFIDLVFATYLGLLGKKVAVVASKERLQGSADSLLLDPFRSRIVCDALGLAQKPEKDAFTPDFQILSPEFRVDFFWDRPRREFALARDLGKDWKKFSSLIDRLVELGNSYQEEIKKFKIIDFGFKAGFWPKIFSKARPNPRGETLGGLFREFDAGERERQLVLSALRIVSPYFQESSPLFCAGLLWRFLFATGEGGSGRDESWESVFEMLAANGALIQEPAVSVSARGKRLERLKVQPNREIEAECYFAEPNTLFYLLEEEKREARIGKGLVGKFPRATFFSHIFRMNAEAWPEAMTDRCLWLSGEQKEPKELLLIAKKATPKTISLSISYGLRKGEAKPLESFEIFQALQKLLPWLTEKKLEGQLEPFGFHQHLRFHPSQLSSPEIKTSFTNLYLPPSELVPFFGFTGMLRFAEALAEVKDD